MVPLLRFFDESRIRLAFTHRTREFVFPSTERFDLLLHGFLFLIENEERIKIDFCRFIGNGSTDDIRIFADELEREHSLERKLS